MNANVIPTKVIARPPTVVKPNEVKIVVAVDAKGGVRRIPVYLARGKR
jgi:hypothetical protein